MGPFPWKCVSVCVHCDRPISRQSRSVVPHIFFSSDEELSELTVWSRFMDIGETLLDLKYSLHSSWTKPQNTNNTEQIRQSSAKHYSLRFVKWSFKNWGLRAYPLNGHWRCTSAASVQGCLPPFQLWSWRRGKDWPCLYGGSVRSGSGHGNELNACPPVVKGWMMQNFCNHFSNGYVIVFFFFFFCMFFF